MAKLLRITTDSNDGTFDVDLDDSYDLQADSKVALQSANFTFNTAVYEATHLNDRFNLFLQFIGAKEVVIRDLINAFDGGRQLYNNRNFIDAFLPNFSASCNFVINTQGNILEPEAAGVQVRASVDNNHKVNIEMKKSRLLDWNGNTFDTRQLSSGNMNTGANHFRQTAPEDESLDPPIGTAFVIDRVPFCLGGGFARCRIRHLQAADPGSVFNGFTFGIVEEENIDKFVDGRTIDEEDFYCGIQVFNDTNVVETLNSGKDGDRILNPIDGARGIDNALGITPTNTGAAGGFDNNDGIAITCENGNFVFRYYDVGNPAGRILSLTTAGLDDVFADINKVDYSKTYYVALIIDDSHTRLEKCGATNDPFIERHSNAQETSLLSTHESVMSLTNVPNVPEGNTYFNINFNITDGFGVSHDNTDLRNFLGYTSDELNPLPAGANPANPPKQSSYNFIAELTSRSLLTAETFLVQLVSLPVESYDTKSGKKENTIYTIVENTILNPTQEISFNSQYPIFIQLKNKNNILLRRLKARIVDHELKPILTIGDSQLTLLFSD